MRLDENNARRRQLSADRVVAKAIELADTTGVEALSMRKLAAALGVTAMSLYNHVEDKEALFGRMLDRVVSEFESPKPGGDWEEMMRRRAHSMRRAFLRHRWAPLLLISEIAVGEAILRDTDATLGCLVGAGFTYGQADWARNAIDSHVYGYTLQELNYPVAPEEYQATAAQYLPMIPEADYPFMHEAAVQIVEGKYDGMTSFPFGLELVLEGLKRWLSGG